MAFSNTFISLDDVDISSLSAGKYLRVRPSGNLEISQYDISVSDLFDVQATGAYTATVGQTLIYSADNKWRPGTLDVYSAGNGLNKSGLTLNVQAGVDGGLLSNSNGIYISDIANVSGTYGNATHHTVFTVNSKGQVTNVSLVASTITRAETLNASYVGNVVGTSGQISVVGGTGLNSNATLNLVATGVTAGIYGNATHAPRITVDTYGRISSVDAVEISGAGNSSSSGSTLGFANIHVAGYTSIGADKSEDDLTFAGGTGINASTDANTDTIYFSINPVTAAGAMNIADFADVDATGVSNGQVLIWNSSTSKYETGYISSDYGNAQVANYLSTNGYINTAIELTDIRVTTRAASGNGSLTYNNATGEFIFTPANISAGGSGTNQSLSWNSGTNVLSISSGNTVDLSVLDQTLSLVGNTLSISGGNSVDLSSFAGGGGGSSGIANLSGNNISDLGDVSSTTPTDGQALVWDQAGNTWKPGTVASAYGNTEVQAYLTAQGYSNVDSDGQTLNLSGNTITISGSNSSVSGIATESYVTAQLSLITDGASDALDTLAEIANALNNSNATLSTVAFTGNYNDLTSRPSMTLSGNTYLSYDGANIDLSGVVGVQGPQGNAGANGISVTGASVSTNNLIITLSDSSIIDAGNVKGPQGDQGPQGIQGDGNAGITNASVNGSGNLILSLANNTTIDAGNVKGSIGPQGDTGSAGVGVTSVLLVSSNLVLTYSNSTTSDLGNIQGPAGPQGAAGTNGTDGIDGIDGNDGSDGISISNALVDVTGNLILTLSDASTIDAGNVRGADGAVDQTLSLTGNTLTISGSNSSVDLSSFAGGGGATPGGIGSEVQYRNGSNFAGDAKFSYDGTVLSVGISGQTGKLRSYSLHSPQNVSSMSLGTHNGTSELAHISLSASGSSTYTVIHGGLSFVTDSTGNRYASFDGTDIYGLPLGNLTNVSNATPSDGQALVWDQAGNTWKPGTVSSSGGSGTTYTGSTGITVDNSANTIALANTAVTAGTYGSATKSPRITVDQQGRITSVTEATISGGSGGSGGGASIERFKLNYTSAGALSSTANLTSGINSVTINSTSGGECTIEFTSDYHLPPGSIIMYGYDHTNNKYTIVPMDTTMGYREIPAGGTSGNPTLFNGADTLQVKLRLREAETGASRGGFGTTTHAWIQFVMQG